MKEGTFEKIFSTHLPLRSPQSHKRNLLYLLILIRLPYLLKRTIAMRKGVQGKGINF